MVAPYDGCFVTREVGQLTRLASGSTRILQLVLLSLVSGGRLCSLHALAGPAGEDVVSAGQALFIQPPRGCLLRRGHGRENELAPLGH